FVNVHSGILIIFTNQKLTSLSSVYKKFLSNVNLSGKMWVMISPKGGSRLRSTKNGKCPKLACGLALGTCACKRMPLRRRAACCTKSLLHLKQRSFLFPFSVPHKRRLHMGTANVKNNDNPKVNPKVKSNSNTHLATSTP
ncbi:hypothetical protein ACO0LG_29150, partial [Undibacterium sp. Ji42W]|uniref:hypothetical protein n=1 Tax=Undibacterium sp. Ji42W TaxID=3413039 RepID=UPI003BF3E9F8